MKGSTSVNSNISTPYHGFPPDYSPPFGATILEQGVHFTLFSRHATSVDILLFDTADQDVPSRRIALDPENHKSGNCWHIFIKGIREGQLYLYQVNGPYAPMRGHRFNQRMFLLDPYAKALTGHIPWGLSSALPKKNRNRSIDRGAADIPKCLVVDDSFDWQGIRRPDTPMSETVIYETHLRGFTRHPSATEFWQVQHPGTYAAIIDMIPYFHRLGITCLELLPVFEFDEHEFGLNTKLPDGMPKTNYWGYSTAAFFAPKGTYARSSEGGAQVREFKTMVRELHRAGIELILDVVFNHTGEGNSRGPTFSFRGLDNTIYYMLEHHKRHYRDYSGCGNTFNCSHPVVQNFIIDCLRYWYQTMQVDGFRFDLASILSRDGHGNLMDRAPPPGSYR